MAELAAQKKDIFDRSYKISAAAATVFAIGSLVLNYLAGTYATGRASNAVSDILLDILPVFNVTAIFVYGFISFCVFVVILMILDLVRLPFVLKSMALLVAVRSAFVTLTHLAPSPHILVDFDGFNFVLKKLIFSGDLFFSAHTALPFLLAFLYWDKKSLRIFFLIVSGVFAVTVLLGHLHYSIDVFAAFFIAYGVFRLSQIFFKKDLAFFLENSSRGA